MIRNLQNILDGKEKLEDEYVYSELSEWHWLDETIEDVIMEICIFEEDGNLKASVHRCYSPSENDFVDAGDFSEVGNTDISVYDSFMEAYKEEIEND